MSNSNKILLNNFEIKILFNHLKEFNLIGIVPDICVLDKTHYTFYFIYKDVLCHYRINYSGTRHINNRPDFSKFLSNLEIRLKDRIFTFENHLFEGRSASKSEVINVALNLSWSIVDNFNALNRNKFIHIYFDSEGHRMVKKRCKSMLKKGFSPAQIYKEYFNLYSFNESELCAAIKKKKPKGSLNE